MTRKLSAMAHLSACLCAFIFLGVFCEFAGAAPILIHGSDSKDLPRQQSNSTLSRVLYEENPVGDRCHPDRYGAKYIPPSATTEILSSSRIICHVNTKLYSPDIDKHPWYVDPTCSLTMPDVCEAAPSYFLNNENDEENKEIKCQPICPRFFPPHGCAPSIFVIGAHRAAITALHRFFGHHPDFCPSQLREEHKYSNFSRISAENRKKKYVSKFPAQKNCLTGDFAPIYLYSPVVARRMLEDWPEARIIVILRNPTRRALSHYKLSLSKLVSKSQKDHFGTFGEEITKNIKNGESHHFDSKAGTLDVLSFQGQHSSVFLERGMYADFLSMWMKLFPPTQLFVTTYEDLTNPRLQSCVLKSLYRFAGIRSELHKAHKMLLPPHGSLDTAEVDQADLDRLDNFYRPFNRRLSALLGRDLGYPV